MGKPHDATTTSGASFVAALPSGSRSHWKPEWIADSEALPESSKIFAAAKTAVFRTRRTNIAAMGAVTGVFVFLTPWIYPFKGLPGFLLSYVNGNEHPWYFSFFPWAAFTLAGITFGYLLLEAKMGIGEQEFFKRVAVAGVCAYAVGAAMSLTRIFEYGFFDYSLTSPHFFFVRLGWILLILYGAYLWSTRAAAARTKK